MPDYSYTRTEWASGMPITQERMINIEDGIGLALAMRNDINAAADTANSAQTLATDNQGRIQTAEGNITSLNTRLTQTASNGTQAMEQIHAATDGHVPPYTDLEGRFSAIERYASDEHGYRLANSNAINAAKRPNMENDTLKARFESVESGVSTLNNGYQSLYQELVNAGGFTNSGVQQDLSARLNKIDGGSTPERTLPNVISELTEAHGLNNAHGNLNTRFTTIESEIADARSSHALQKNGADKSYDTLDARFEAIEEELVGTNAISSRIDTLTTNIGTINSNISSLSTAYQTADTLLTNRIDSVETNYQAADTAINNAIGTDSTANTIKGRIKALEDEVDMASADGNRRIDLVETRLSAIDGGTNTMINSINDKIDTIAGELGMTDTNGLKTIGTRVDDLAADIATFATELGMTRDGNNALIDTNSRVDQIAYDISHTASGSDTTTGLTQRVGVLESDLNTATTGLKARVDAIDNASTGAIKALQDADDALDARLDAIDGGTALTGTALGTRVTNLETAVNDGTSGLAATKTIADNAASGVSGLTTRVTTLEGKDTIIVNKPVSGSNYTNELPNTTAVATPSADADYLIQNDDDKYYYWRYINNSWELISGAGGGGTGSSSGEFAASLESITTPDINTDYFVGNNNIGYTHYRYVVAQEGQPGTFVRILPKGLLTGAGVTNTGGLEAYTIDNNSTNVFEDFVAFKDVEASPVKDENEQVIATDLVFTDTNGTTHTARVQGGGGGGAVSSYTMRLSNTLNSLKLTVPKKDGYTAYIRSKVVVKDSGVIDTEFDQSHTINVSVKYSLSKNGPWTNYTNITALNNTEFSVDITSVLTLGVTTYIRVEASTLIDEEEKTSSLIYEVTQVEMSIAAVNFNQATVRTTNFNFQYRCMGSGLTKQIHFLIDGADITGSPITSTLHNDIGQQNIPLTGLQAGMHSFQVYFTVDGIESNVLNYYIIYNNDNTRVAPIVALAAEKSTITFGDDLKINYTVATIGTETTDEVLLELYTLNGSTETVLASQSFLNVENETMKEWRPVDYPESGTAYVRATATHTVDGTAHTDTKTIQITINALVLPAGYSLDPSGTANLVYSYNAYGRTNNDAGKETYHYNYHALTGQTIEWTGTFNGFNWSGDGYVDGQTLTISGGATHTVNVPIFQNAYNGVTLENSEGVSNISKLGRTIEIEYEVASATDLNDVIIDYMADVTNTTENGITYTGGTGFQVTPQSCYLLKSGSTINRDNTGFIINESDIAAAYLTPGTRIHLAFVIEPWSDTLAYDQSYHQSVNIYVNGEFANACPYVQGTDSFASSATLRIGSSSCIIKLYQIKMYNRGLTHKEILQNYKVAPAATRDKLTRLYDNDILNADGLVDYEKAKTKYTCLLLTGPEPIYTTTTGGETVLSNPTVSPYKGYPSPAGRKNKKTNKTEKKTESGVTLTKANPNVAQGYDVEFDLRDVIPTDQNIPVEAYLGARGAYVSSNNVQGTSSQKYPVHNLKVYLAKWQAPKTNVTWVDLEENEEVEQGTETRTVTKKQVPKTEGEGYDWVIVEEGEDTTGLTTEEFTQKKVETITPGEIKKVKYSLKGKDEHGDDIGYAESTLCWKADYMSTDHANTFNANIADGLFTDTLPGASWGSKHQNTVYGIRCLLFQQQGNNAPEFLGDGCLNNDKGNNKTYDLERDGDKDDNTSSQKWEFTNNSDDLGYFKTDTVFRTIGEGANAHIQATDAFESTYPDQGDLEDAGKVPNYNHLQILLTWLSKRANYWDETDPATRAAKKQIFIDEFEDHINLNHALTYYLFSEYVALCDNRVKNMFFRSDNVKSETVYKISDHQPIFEGNSNPNADFFKQIDAIDTGTTQQVAIEDPETHEISYETQTVYRYELHNRDDIDWENSTFAVWAPVLYDLDSCFGVENVGYIRVRYDAGWDYAWNGAPQFNGYESRLWLQFADCFDSEIKAAALALYNRADGLNYTNFYRQQITGNLENISPALSNQDMLVKFDKPWSEGFINYSLAEPAMETPYYKYLQRGSRTAQKTAFMNMRSKLLSSKYGATEFTNDSIKFRTGVPVGDNNLQDTKITVVANQVMYPGVAYGDNKDPTRATANGGKVNAGQSCDIYAGSPVQGNDGIFICGASVLTDIGDLSAFHPYQLDLGAGVNLKRLIVGSHAAGYTNGQTNNFQNLNKCTLLEEVNIENCTALASLDLSTNALIKRVYAKGSGATTLIFPNGGVLNTVEYSSVTGNITLLNQKNLINFVYDGAETNHYSSLNKLWIENTPNVPVVDIINTAISNLTAGIRLVGLDIDLYQGASTEEETEAALETTTLFLNTLVSDLAKGKYLDSTGAFTPGNTQYPYISGKVHITSIRNSLLAKLNSIYPNLVIYNTIDGNGVPANNTVTEYTIEYRNYDGTLLYTDYRTGREHFIDPASFDERDIDPITGKNRLWSICPPDGIPKKPQDAQYQYAFGSYDNGDYIRYSGWVKQYTTTSPVDDDYPQGNTVFVAYYPTTTVQRYTVNWYEEPAGTAIYSYTNIPYGTDMSEYTQPEERNAVTRVKIDNNTNQIKVFKGWDRPVGRLTDNINVYAVWETSSIDNGVQPSDITMDQLTAADLAAIARLGPEAKRRILEDKLGNDPIMLQMGHDFYYTNGVNTTNLLNGSQKLVFNNSTTDAKIFDGNHGTLPEVRPLAVNSDWTLALDYKFLLTPAMYSNGSGDYVLASCYSNVNSTIQGFKLSLVKNTNVNSNTTISPQYIRLTWGTDSINLDCSIVDTGASDPKQYNQSYRNVIVLRHKASEPTKLQVYYSQSLTTDGTLNLNIDNNATELIWNNMDTLDAPLILGGNYVDPSAASPEIENGKNTNKPAKGIIYWGKFWDKDLGAKYCRILSSWPHEKIPFYLSGYDNNESPTRQILENTNLTFIAAQSISDRYAYTYRNELPATNGYFGWRETESRIYCNSRIYKGASTAFQSIIIQTPVDSISVSTTNENSIVTVTTQDYFYLASECEVNGKSSVSNLIKLDEVSSAWPSPWPWMQTAQNIHNLYGFASGGNVLELKSAANIKPFLYRFIGNYIKPTARIFNINVDPYNNGNPWLFQDANLNNEQISVQSGDVWISDEVAYIYYTNAEINEGVYVDIVTGGGGWKKADLWRLRTKNIQQLYTYENLLEVVEDDGSVTTTPSNKWRVTEGHILCPEFSI